MMGIGESPVDVAVDGDEPVEVERDVFAVFFVDVGLVIAEVLSRRIEENATPGTEGRVR